MGSACYSTRIKEKKQIKSEGRDYIMQWQNTTPPEWSDNDMDDFDIHEFDSYFFSEPPELPIISKRQHCISIRSKL